MFPVFLKSWYGLTKQGLPIAEYLLDIIHIIWVWGIIEICDKENLALYLKLKFSCIKGNFKLRKTIKNDIFKLVDILNLLKHTVWGVFSCKQTLYGINWKKGSYTIKNIFGIH